MKPNLAIVHDYLTTLGGAEMTLKSICQIWPKAPVYTLLHDPEKITSRFLKNPIHPSFLSRLPRFLQKRKKFILPLLTVAPETFDLRDFDVVISSSGAFSKGIITKPNTLNICYCHSPMRFAWDYTHEYLRDLKTNRLRNLAARLTLNYVRLWDAVSSDRADYLIANSQATRQKIQKYYRRSSTVIYPPVETKLFRQNPKAAQRDEGYFLIVSRLSAYKKIDLVIEAFNKLGWKLIVIGTGPELPNLKKLAGPTVKILGYKKRQKTVQYFKNCRGYVQPSDEDFGISAVEAMAAGKPVLALASGGALETVKAGETGEFFSSPTIELIAEGVFRLNHARKSYHPAAIQKHARKFSQKRFQREITEFVEEKRPVS